MEPVGIALSTYVEPLNKVAVKHDKEPINSFPSFERLMPMRLWYEADRLNPERPCDVLRTLPLRAFKRFSFDELCKLKFSSAIMLRDCVESLFNEDPSYRIVRKIMLSMWHWGSYSESWNQLVDAYDGIRNFSFDLPDFEVRFDYTVSVNERGSGEHSRIWLDGELGFLVHYRGQHVMTIGFSVAGKDRVLLQQVQTVKRKGNRFLFKLPKNYLEFIIERFTAAFPGKTIYVADGGGFAEQYLEGYRRGVAFSIERITKITDRMARNVSDDWDEKSLSMYTWERDSLEEKVSHLEADLPRLRAFYADTGRFKQGKAVRHRDLKHYPLAVA